MLGSYAFACIQHNSTSDSTEDYSVTIKLKGAFVKIGRFLHSV